MKAQVSKIPEGWQKISLGEIGTTLSGLTGKTKENFGHGKPFIPYMNVFKNSHIDKDFVNLVELQDDETQNRLQYGDYIFTTSSETPEEVGMSTVVNTDLGEAYLNSFCFIFRPERKVLDPDFGGYLFRGPDFRKEISTFAKGSTRYNLSKRDFLGVEILFPESELEQKKIAEILFTVDAQIKETEKVISKSEKLKEGLMSQLLTRGIGHSEFLSSDVGEIPKGWSVLKLSEIATITRGGSPRPIEEFITTDDDGLNWLKIGDIEPGAKYITRTGQKIKRSGLSKTTLVHDGDFILSNSMSFGRPYIMKIDACIHDGWLAFKDIKTNLVSAEFLYYLLSSKVLQKAFWAVAAGSGVKNLKRESVSNILVALPTVDEQKKIAEAFSRVDAKISIDREIRDKLLLLKKGMMSDLLSGKKQVV